MKKRASLLTVAVFLFLSLSLLCPAEEIRKYTNKIGMEFSYIPLGQFDMGSTSPEAGSDEQPVHKSTITKGFWMAKHEVTQGLWKQVMGTNPSENKKGDDYPVENVSWKDAQKFLKKLGSMTGEKYRLPTEAEWEFAARAGSSKERGPMVSRTRHGSTITPRRVPIPLGVRLPTSGGSSICSATSWSGVRIGTVPTATKPPWTLKDHPRETAR